MEHTQYYAISEVARRLDTSIGAVRYYSDRHPEIPDRRLITRKQRMKMYTEEDIELLKDTIGSEQDN
jgi:DNA-binding transcriptional MerR regulator